MKVIISILSLLWIFLVLLAVCEPTGQTVKVPEYVGTVYVILFLGLPFLISALLPKAK